MLRFDELLQANQIQAPTKKSREPAWIFTMRASLFEMKWVDSRKQYNKLESICSELGLKPWNEDANKFLLANYGVKMPEKLKHCFNPAILFSTPKEAKNAICQAQVDAIEWGNRNDFRMFTGVQRKKWFYDDIMGNMPAGCKLIVLKDKDYVPHELSVTEFKDSVRQCRNDSISEWLGIWHHWVAIKPDDVESIHFECWAINPLNCSVEYIV